MLDEFSIVVNKGDKIAFVGPNSQPKSLLFDIIMGEKEADAGEYTWGVTTTQAYFPKDNSSYFDGVNMNLVEWLRQYSKDQDETFLRGFLGRMLFAGEEALKKASVLSGGEKVRCMLAKMMLNGANVLVFDEPTNHLDLESITALNNGLIDFDGTILFTSHDHQFIQTIANRIIEITPAGVIDRTMTYDEYLENPEIREMRARMYPVEV
ncbi:putative ABC transporter ATP-binding protein [compost metagenome]